MKKELLKLKALFVCFVNFSIEKKMRFVNVFQIIFIVAFCEVTVTVASREVLKAKYFFILCREVQN